MNISKFNELVIKLYGSLLDRDGFQSFLVSLINVYQFRSATVVIINQSTGFVKAVWTHGLDAKWIQAYEEEKFKDQDPRARSRTFFKQLNPTFDLSCVP